jgi:hypothetical protein
MKNENRPWVGFEVHQLNVAKRGEPLTAIIAIKNVGKSGLSAVRREYC